MSTDEYAAITINQRVLPSMETAVKRRSWHMWGAAVFVGICILLASNQIAVALNSYCPEDTGVVLRSS